MSTIQGAVSRREGEAVPRGMDDALRRQWVQRLEREAFGCLRPPESAYAAFHARWHARAVWAVVLFVPVVLLVSHWWGRGISLLLLLALLLVAYQRTKRSVLWGWFLYGHSVSNRVDAVPPTASWKALQADAGNSESEALKQLALRRWVTYRAALAALGDPFPNDGVILRGMGLKR